MIGVAMNVVGWFASASGLNSAPLFLLALAEVVVTMLVAATR